MSFTTWFVGAFIVSAIIVDKLNLDLPSAFLISFLISFVVFSIRKLVEHD